MDTDRQTDVQTDTVIPAYPFPENNFGVGVEKG